MARKSAARPRRTLAQRLELAIRLAKVIEANPLFELKAGLRLEIKYSGTGTMYILHEPDEHQTRSLLIDVRKFVMPGEDVYLPTLLKLARRYVDDPSLAHAIESAEKTYPEIAAVGTVKLELQTPTGTRALRPADVFRLLLYSDMFHNDLDKETELANLAGIPPPFIRHSFFDFAFEVAQMVIWLGGLFEAILERGVLRDAPVPLAAAHPP